MTTVRELCTFLDAFAPNRLAAEWDNVGLLAGDFSQPIARVMTCLTVTPASVEEAISRRTDLIITHHPLPFRPFKRLTTTDTPSRLLWTLARGGVAVYSPHTAFDSAAEGINQQLAEGVGLTEIRPLRPIAGEPPDSPVGSGRIGKFTPAFSLREVAQRLATFLRIPRLQVVGDLNRPISTVATACGSGESYLPAVIEAGADLLITGEASFHPCLEAEARNLALLLPGHYASERFALETLASRLQRAFPSLEIWPSALEHDPLCWFEAQ